MQTDIRFYHFWNKKRSTSFSIILHRLGPRRRTVVDDEEAYSEDSAAIQVDRLIGRTRYWAFGGVQCKHPEKLLVKTKRCIIVLLSN